ncbi:hypothetical protein TEA_013946 [Camellia sinensis var. sinensis]|uniref:WAT1-related protein n=1 Tax=Camellia sinensis var. sinensis TaxID=542762 RepID=A0A4S4ES61_CAMSN|nr:hypothetical protein TEA_013946 [Camellia sinensis var. sinensis]
MGKIANTIHGLKPAMMMVVVQATMAGNSVFYKLASSIGMSLSVLIAYRFVFDASFIVPLVLLLERMERLGLGTMIGKAKVAGTLMCIGGAMLLMFYKGAELNICSTNVDFLHHKGGHVVTLHPHDSNDVVGALLVVFCCVSGAIGLIAKAKMIQDYPCVYSSIALIMTMTAIQAIGFALSTLHG